MGFVVHYSNESLSKRNLLFLIGKRPILLAISHSSRAFLFNGWDNTGVQCGMMFLAVGQEVQEYPSDI